MVELLLLFLKTNNMHKTIENIIKKNLPEKVGYLIPDILKDVDIDKALPSAIGARAFNQALSQIDTSLIADEVLKVAVETLDIEKLAELEHEQWCDWSRNLRTTEKLSPERVMRWEELWINYKDLPEEQKESDRKYARKILQLLTNSSTLEGEQSEHLSTNKENENNEKI